MAAAHYDIGDAPIVTATCAPLGDDEGISTAITFTVRAPDGTITTYEETDPEVTGDVDNVWLLAMPRLDQWGTWHVHAESTSGIQAGESTALIVDRARALE